MGADDFNTGQDLLYYVLVRAGQSESASDDYANRVQGFVLDAYWTVLQMHKWPFAMASSPGVLTTSASQSVTISSITSATPGVVTLSATIATSQAGKKIFLNSTQAMYRIASHTAGTDQLTLDAKYVETTTSGPATIFQDEYALATTAIKIWSPLRPRGTYWNDIDVLEENDFRSRYGHSGIAGPGPIEAAMWTRRDSAGSIQLQLAPWSEDAVNIEYDYTQFVTLTFDGVAGTDTPVIPRQDRVVVAYKALYDLMADKNDTRADGMELKAQRKLKEMVSVHLPATKSQAFVRPKNSLTLGCT